MTTKEQMIEIIKAENPDGLQLGDDNNGYSKLTDAQYDAQIEMWAEGRLAKQAKIAEDLAIVEAKTQAAQKLVELGIDPKAFGL
jgi:hypothetical protein